MSHTDQASHHDKHSELKRVLSFSDVLAYGLVYFVPIAPMAVFGLIFNASAGMVALVYLVAAIAMIFSAISYSEMAKKIPLAGSVYSYVTHGSNDRLGFIAGWALLLDYLLLPALLSILGAAALSAQFPGIPTFWVLAAFVAVPSVVNLFGISLNARLSKVLLAVQLCVLMVFVLFAIWRFMQWRLPPEQFIAPFYRKKSFSLSLIFSAVPIAALSYIGFDAVSTLNEEAQGGGPTVSKATMALLVIVTILFVGQVYLAAALVPVGTHYENGTADTSFYMLTTTVVGQWFLPVVSITSGIVALMANTLVSQATTARVLYSMARDKRLPRYLGKVHPRTQVPSNAVITVAVVSFAIALIGANYLDVMVTLVTFGALTAYILLHISVFVYFRRLRGAKFFAHTVSPVVGILLLTYALWATNIHAKVLGVSWLTVGSFIAYAMRKQHGSTTINWDHQ